VPRALWLGALKVEHCQAHHAGKQERADQKWNQHTYRQIVDVQNAADDAYPGGD
jgi:hypothetical protein